MTRDVETRLASWFDQYAIGEQLHDVPPHAVYEVSVDGRRAVCKVARGETADVGAEAAAIAHADRNTDLPVPSVLAAGEDAFVATWIDGLPAEGSVSAEDVDDGYARALGRAMGRLHAATEDDFARPGFPRLASEARPDRETDDRARAALAVDGRDSWQAAARALVADVREHLAAIGWAEPAADVLSLLDDRPGLFAGVGRPVLCHGNLLPDHVGFDRPRPTARGSRSMLVDYAPRNGSGPATAAGEDRRLSAVVDFEHAMVAPAGYDFWRTVLPVFHTGDLEYRPTMAAFREGYESVRSLPPGVECRREAWWLVITVTYLLALDVQNDGIGPDEREQAEAMTEWVRETVAAVRERTP